MKCILCKEGINYLSFGGNKTRKIELGNFTDNPDLDDTNNYCLCENCLDLSFDNTLVNFNSDSFVRVKSLRPLIAKDIIDKLVYIFLSGQDILSVTQIVPHYYSNSSYLRINLSNAEGSSLDLKNISLNDELNFIEARKCSKLDFNQSEFSNFLKILKEEYNGVDLKSSGNILLFRGDYYVSIDLLCATALTEYNRDFGTARVIGIIPIYNDDGFDGVSSISLILSDCDNYNVLPSQLKDLRPGHTIQVVKT